MAKLELDERLLLAEKWFADTTWWLRGPVGGDHTLCEDVLAHLRYQHFYQYLRAYRIYGGTKDTVGA
jgi:hypothetical protein